MIKNIVFDIGNVLLTWQPANVVKKLFPESDVDQLTQLMFKSPTWNDLNLGKLTEKEIIQIYHRTLNIDLKRLNDLMLMIKESLLPIAHSFDLLHNLYKSGYSLYALTDNVREIIDYLKSKYDFWSLFKGIICSSEVGYLKPMPEIYMKLIENYSIKPSETVFIDDIFSNVEGAKAMGIYGIQFINTKQCINELNKIFNLVT